MKKAPLPLPEGKNVPGIAAPFGKIGFTRLEGAIPKEDRKLVYRILIPEIASPDFVFFNGAVRDWAAGFYGYLQKKPAGEEKEFASLVMRPEAGRQNILEIRITRGSISEKIALPPIRILFSDQGDFLGVEKNAGGRKKALLDKAPKSPYT